MLLLSYLDWLYAFQGFCVYWPSYREKTDKMEMFFLSGSSYDREKQNERIERLKEIMEELQDYDDAMSDE